MIFGVPMLFEILSIVAPVFAIAAIGYAWRRLGQPFQSDMVATLVVNVGTPALLLSSLLGQKPALGAMADIALAAVATTALMAGAAAATLRILRLPIRVYLPVMTFPNAGNMGLPLCLFAFGDAGLALAITYFTCNALMQFSVGHGVASGGLNVRETLTNPVLWGVSLALVLLAAGLGLPVWTMNTLEVLGGLVLPLMMLSLGASLAGLTVSDLPRSVGMALFRMGGGFVAALIVCEILGLEGIGRGVVLIQAAMPPAVFNYMFALRYNNQPGEVAGIVLVSTVLSVVALPLLLAFVLAR
jgi:predicted permease